MEPEETAALLFCPFATPDTDIDRFRTVTERVTIAMAPPPGNFPVTYDLSNPQHVAICGCNQLIAMGWNIMRSALESLGAQIIVADSIISSKREALNASDNFPIQEFFSRDAGLALNNYFIVPACEVVQKFSLAMGMGIDAGAI